MSKVVVDTTVNRPPMRMWGKEAMGAVGVLPFMVGALDPHMLPRGLLEALALVISATTDSITGSVTAETAVEAVAEEATEEVHFTSNNNNNIHNKTTTTK